MDDRVALVTGADGGLGSAVVRVFREAGLTVVTASHRGGDVRADLTVAAEADRAVAEILARHKRLDIAAHLVGGFDGGAPVDETTDQTWRRMLDLNLNSAFYVARAAVKVMRAAGRGRFLAIGSRTAVEPSGGFAAYGVSKAGLVALVRTLALELKGTGVTANAVLPSIIDTPVNRAAMPDADPSGWVAPEAIAGLLL
jgi:NAD(P)-dependent dehydrogenase (short-subunit alcohol dehydrogenase family)